MGRVPSTVIRARRVLLVLARARLKGTCIVALVLLIIIRRATFLGLTDLTAVVAVVGRPLQVAVHNSMVLVRLPPTRP